MRRVSGDLKNRGKRRFFFESGGISGRKGRNPRNFTDSRIGRITRLAPITHRRRRSWSCADWTMFLLFSLISRTRKDPRKAHESGMIFLQGAESTGGTLFQNQVFAVAYFSSVSNPSSLCSLAFMVELDARRRYLPFASLYISENHRFFVIKAGLPEQVGTANNPNRLSAGTPISPCTDPYCRF